MKLDIINKINKIWIVIMEKMDSHKRRKKESSPEIFVSDDEDVRALQEQEELQKPLSFRNFIKDSIPEATKEKIKEFWYWHVWYQTIFFFKKVDKFKLIQTIVMVILVGAFLINLRSPKVEEADKADRAYGTMRKMQQLKKTHSYYANITEEEIYHVWKDLYLGVRYQMDGNLKYKTADCVGGVFNFLKSYGYAGEILNVNTLDDKIDKLAAAGLQKIRLSVYQVKPGDIIIFNPIQGIGHVGIVECVRGNYVLYVDINGAVGPAENWIMWNDPGKWGRIKKIAEVSYAFWCGDVWKEYNNQTVVDDVTRTVEIPIRKEE